MKTHVRYASRTRDTESLVESVAAATTAAMASAEEPTVLAYTPPARGNPYQQLLYSAALDLGVGAVPTLSIAEFDGLRWPYPTALHLHWTTGIAQQCDSLHDAHAAVDEACAAMAACQERGTAVAWTVHNVLPHSCRWLEPELVLRRWLAENADLVHILGEPTIDLVADHYRLERDERLVVVPHPTYAGVYPDHVTRAEARLELGIAPDTNVGLLLGSLRDNKGIELLAQAVDELDDSWQFIIAGAPSDDAARDEIVALADADRRLEIWPRRIGLDEVQLFHRAADVAVLPYTDGLNSGVAYLAWTFGLPVVATSIGSLGSSVRPPLGMTFRAGDPKGLADACSSVVREQPSDRARALAELAEDRAPRRISAAFISELLQRVQSA